MHPKNLQTKLYFFMTLCYLTLEMEIYWEPWDWTQLDEVDDSWNLKILEVNEASIASLSWIDCLLCRNKIFKKYFYNGLKIILSDMCYNFMFQEADIIICSPYLVDIFPSVPMTRDLFHLYKIVSYWDFVHSTPQHSILCMGQLRSHIKLIIMRI